MCLLPVAVPHSCWRRGDAESSCGFKKTRKWGICYSDMPVAGIYDAAALHLDLKMLESIGPLPASAFELIRKGHAFAKKKRGWVVSLHC
jgi:hypothetical protein